MPLTPTVECHIYPVTGTDQFGRDMVSGALVTRCCVIKLVRGVDHTSVRADSSGSRGAAEEIVADARLLIPATTDVAERWRIDVAGITLRIVSVMPRFDAVGRLDHYQVDASAWA